MKTNKIKILFMCVAIAAFASCKKDNADPIKPDEEHKFVRLLLADANSNELSLINPINSEVVKFNAKHPKGALYTSESGRFTTIIHREFNYVEVFDSGFEFHGDHVDFKGTPKFAALTGTPNKPTHFKSKGNEIITFNDGDGTLSVANEADFHNPGATLRTINAGLLAHHGAMTKFNNGNYAVTVKDGSVAGSLPERVKIINNTGAEVSASTIQTKGIHGNASNGLVSLFGSSSGILMVKQDGNQELITYPSSFGTAWFGTILETSNPNKFIGYTAALGAYSIDITTKAITPILESNNIMQCKTDYSKKNLIILLHDGNLKIFNASTSILKQEGKVITETLKTDTSKPFLVATARYVYVVNPKTKEINQINSNNFSDVKKINLSNTPSSIAIVGFENSVAH